MPTAEQTYIKKLERRGRVHVWKALEEACAKGWPALAALAVRHRPDLTHPTHRAKLAWAMRPIAFRGDSEGRAAVMRVLVEAGLDPAAPGLLAGSGPLVARVLLDAGAPVDGTGPEDRTLHLAIEGRTKQDTTLLLLGRGADINLRDDEGRTPLIVAAQEGRTMVVRELLKRGADPTAVDVDGRSAFRHAVEASTHLGRHAHGDTDVKQALTIARLLADVAPAQPEDAVLAILLRDDAAKLRDLLASGLSPHETLSGTVGIGVSPDRWSHLGLLMHNMPDRLRQVFNVPGGGQTVDAAAGGSSLLFWATALAAKSCVKALLDAGADPDTADGMGGTPRLLAERLSRLRPIRKLFDPAEPEPEPDPTTPAGRLGLDPADLHKRLDQCRESLADAEDQEPEVRLLNTMRFAEELMRLAHLLGDAATARDAAGRVMDCAAESLRYHTDELTEWDRYGGQYHDYAEVAVAVLAAGALLGRMDDAIPLLLAHRPVITPRPVGDMIYDPENHAAWLAVTLLAGEPIAADDATRVRAGRSKRARLLLDVAEAITAGDASAAAKALGKVITDHRSYRKRGAYRGGEANAIAIDASALVIVARHRGITLDLRPADRDHLIP